jgi:hypothetical protein
MSPYVLGCGVARPLLVIAGALLAACTEPIVFGSIPPSTFQFVNVVPHDGKGAGGWKVAQVIILLGRLSPRYPETTACDVEVGMPEETSKSRISDEKAQRAAARAANSAAREVLTERLPTGQACIQFRQAMERALNQGGIVGAKVTGFQQTGVPQRTFP